MALYEILNDGTPRKIAGNIASLSAESVALNTTRTGQNDTVVEYYMSSDGNTWYRKWASGWKECGGQLPAGQNVSYEFTLPLAFSDANYNITYTSNANLTSTNTPNYQSFMAYPLTKQTARMFTWSVVRKWYAFGY